MSLMSVIELNIDVALHRKVMCPNLHIHGVRLYLMEGPWRMQLLFFDLIHMLVVYFEYLQGASKIWKWFFWSPNTNFFIGNFFTVNNFVVVATSYFFSDIMESRIDLQSAFNILQFRKNLRSHFFKCTR